MRRLLLFGVALLALVGCVPTNPSPTITDLPVSDEASFAAALTTAASRPGCTIRLTSDLSLIKTAYVRGRGTVLDLNGHTIRSSTSYSGLNDPADGCGIHVMPLMGDPVKGLSKGILCNEAGAVAQIEKALGGNRDGFAVLAPNQYADEPIRGTYALGRTVLIPAEKIVVKNGTLSPTAGTAWGGLTVEWARDVTVQGVRFDYSSVTEINANFAIGAAARVHVVDCDLGGRRVSFNSSYDVSVVRCVGGNVTVEETTRKILIDGCRLGTYQNNDATCGDVTIRRSVLATMTADPGAVALPEISGTNLIDNCDLGSHIWVSFMTQGASLTVQNCRAMLGSPTGYGAPGVVKYDRASGSNVIERNNSWN